MKGKRILIVDDEEDLCEILQYNLSNEGYITEIAHSSEEAMKRPLDKFDLILLDVMMGAMSGFKFADKLIKELKINVPIIFLTAKDTENDILTGFSLGADDYIPKPFHPKEFLARVHSALRTLSLQRELRQKAEELEQQHQMLVATQEQLVRSQRLAAIGEIGLAIRHEINNPLGSILGFVDLLIAQGEAFPENARRKLDAVRRATIRIRDVVRRLEDIQDDRTVEYVQGIQMTDLGVQPPDPLGHVQAVPRPAAEGQQHAPGVGDPDPA
jgi:CheY-like chemotaxis protein